NRKSGERAGGFVFARPVFVLLAGVRDRSERAFRRRGRIVEAERARRLAKMNGDVAIAEVALNRVRDLIEKGVGLANGERALLHFVDEREMARAVLLLQKQRAITLLVVRRGVLRRRVLRCGKSRRIGHYLEGFR